MELVRKWDSPNVRRMLVKIRCVSGRERNKPIRRYYIQLIRRVVRTTVKRFFKLTNFYSTLMNTDLRKMTRVTMRKSYLRTHTKVLWIPPQGSNYRPGFAHVKLAVGEFNAACILGCSASRQSLASATTDASTYRLATAVQDAPRASLAARLPVLEWSMRTTSNRLVKT